MTPRASRLRGVSVLPGAILAQAVWTDQRSRGGGPVQGGAVAGYELGPVGQDSQPGATREDLTVRSWALLVFAASLALDLLAAPSGIPGRLFMQGRDVDAVPVTLARYHGRRVRIFDRQIAYRNDRKACVRFELPQELPLSGTPLRLEVEAYNDDPSYLRALWFEVDGIGGYLAVQRVAKGQYLGEGTIGPGERKRWVLPLNRLELSLDGKASSAVDFDTVFRQSGLHTVCAWISTYAKYGPESWITLDLVGSPEGWDADDSPGRGSNPPVGSRTRSEADTAGPELAGVRASRGQPAGADPCVDKTLLLPERGLRLAIKQNPDTKAYDDQPVCDVLEVSAYQGGESVTLLRRFELNPERTKLPGYLLNYSFAAYLPHPGLAVLSRVKAFRFYDVTAHRLSPAIAAPQCIGEDAQSGNVKRLEPLAQGRFLYGEAVSCEPFLVQTDRPEQRFPFVESVGHYALYRDDHRGLLAAQPEVAKVYRFAARPGRNPRFSLTYFLNERGMVAYRKGDYPRAVEWFEHAAAVTPPDYLYPHTNLAGALMLACQTEAALAQLRQACARAPAFTRSRMLRDTDFGDLRAASQFSDILDGPCAVEAETGVQLTP